MLNRRIFLAGASVTALALIHPAAITEAAAKVAEPRNPAMHIVLDVIRDYFEHIDTWGGSAQLHGARRRLYDEWRNVERIEIKIMDVMHEIYDHPLMTEIKAECGSIMDEPNRLHPCIQLLFPERIPMNLQYAGNRKVFGAFASFAPAHLL